MFPVALDVLSGGSERVVGSGPPSYSVRNPLQSVLPVTFQVHVLRGLLNVLSVIRSAAWQLYLPY